MSEALRKSSDIIASGLLSALMASISSSRKCVYVDLLCVAAVWLVLIIELTVFYIGFLKKVVLSPFFYITDVIPVLELTLIGQGSSKK